MYKKFALIVALSIPLLTGCVAAVATTAVVGTNMATDRRTTGAYIEDQGIELKALEKIAEDKALADSSSITVVSFNRVVLLVGQAPNSALSAKASSLIRGIENVRRVHNEIRIAAPGSFLSGTNDAWLTTKAKSLLLAEKDLSSNHIKVITENGEIFLMGLVTREEAEKSIAVVRDIDGAERVVNVFEYMN